MVEAKAFIVFIIIYSLFRSERLSSDCKLTLHKKLIRSVMAYVNPAWEFDADTPPFAIAWLAKQCFPHHW
jgi:hypothetical protein